MTERQYSNLTRLARTLIDQERANAIVPPYEPDDGFWFGGGNLVVDRDGSLVLVGRYRNHGDSRTGLGAGTRGFELALFRSTDGGASFTKFASFSKADLQSGGHEVVSIEGAKLHATGGGAELFVSSEKAGIDYPPEYASFHKPGTGVWTIDRIVAPSFAELADARPQPLLSATDPRWLHVKDPVVFDSADGSTVLYFCTHPFSWSSSNTAVTVRPAGADRFGDADFAAFPRGYTWDVAATRVTNVVRVPAVGRFAGEDDLCLVFYDGAESLRAYEEHARAVRRPRGYSCEELGGAAVLRDGEFSSIERLSVDLPMFVSPNGTGSSRYVDVLATDEAFYATWEQSQADRSQPLVMNVVSRETVERILSE